MSFRSKANQHKTNHFRLLAEVVLLSILLLISGNLPAQTYLQFEHMGVEEGMTQTSGFDIIQDSDGFIWVATQNGLNRYDGYEFKQFFNNVENPHSLSDNFVLVLFEDSAGGLWVGTRDGLNLYRKASEDFIQYRATKPNHEGLGDAYITALTEDDKGRLWIGTANGGLYYLDIKTGKITANNRSRDGRRIFKHITALAWHEGKLWIGSGNDRLTPSDTGGVQILSTSLGTLTDAQLDSTIPVNRAAQGVKSLSFVNGEMWAGSVAAGLLRWDSSTNKFVKVVSAREISEHWQNPITDIASSSSDSIWFTTQYEGLYKLDLQTNRLNRYSPDIPKLSNVRDNDLVSIYFDRTGVMWIGSWTRGIARLDPGIWQFEQLLRFRTQHADEGQIVRAIAEDKQGNILLAAWHKGLLRFDPVTHEVSPVASLPVALTGTVREVMVDSLQRIWIGTTGSGIFRLNPSDGGVVHFHPSANRDSKTRERWLSHNHVTMIEEGPLGNIWVATRGGGLNEISNGEQVVRYWLPDEGHMKSIADSRIGFVSFDQQGMLWIGCEGKGLDIFDPIKGEVVAHYARFDQQGGLPSNSINAILHDQNGGHWLGTDKGFARINLDNSAPNYRRLSFSRLQPSDGTVTGGVGAIISDNNGKIWISTINAIYSFEPASGAFVRFGKDHGVLTAGYYIRSGHKSPDGTIWFGAVNGLTRFRPEHIQLDTNVPRPKLTNFLLFNRKVAIDQSGNKTPLPRSITQLSNIVLNYSQNVFSLEFSAMHFANPINNHYRYRLIGFDSDWNEVNYKNRRATYTNLDPGKYTFEVFASNKDGLWSEQPARINIEIMPAPWFSPLAITGYILLVTAIISLIVYQVIRIQRMRKARRIAQLEKDYAIKSNELKSKFLANMSHEIRTPMNAILGLTGLAMRLPMTEQLKEYLTKIDQSAASLLRIINDILDYSKVEADKLEMEVHPFDLEDVVHNVMNVVGPAANAKGLELVVNHLEDIEFKLLGDDLRLAQVITNLMNNAIKFTAKGTVALTFDLLQDTAEEVQLKVLVQDTGIGLSPHQIEKIFKPFTQADMSTTRQYGGTGLGLSLSLRLVEMMGGQLEVMSEPGKGATFWFTAKFLKAEREQMGRHSARPMLRQLNVLVIDDNHETLVSLTRMLESFGSKAIPYLACDLTPQRLDEEAIALDQFQLILLDASLPKNNCLEIADYLRAHLDVDTTRIVLMSSVSEIVRAEYRKQFDSVIEKPVTPSELHDGLMSTFSVRAASKRDIPLSKEEQNRLLAKLATKRVLIVEDNLINQQVARELISNLGILVEVASNGLEAIETLKQKKFDMVFMDMQMPIMDGVTATERLKSEKIVTETPIIAMTANAMVGDREKCLQAGMDDYLAKPIRPEKLYACLERWLLIGQNNTGKKLANKLARLVKQMANSSSESVQILKPARDECDAVSTVDFSAALQGFDGDDVLLADVARMFIEQVSKGVYRLESSHSPEQNRLVFHTVKGLAATLCAKKLQKLAEELERNSESFTEQMGEIFKKELEAVCGALQQWLEDKNLGC